MKKTLATLMQPSVTVRGDKGAEQVTALVDTGASYSFIRQSLAERVSTVVPLPTPLTFTLGDASQMRIDNTCVVSCLVDGMTVTDHFMILPDAQAIDSLILGAATLRKYGLKVDLSRNEVFALITVTPTTNSEEVRMDEKLQTLMARLGLTVSDGMSDEQATEAIVAKVQPPPPTSVAAPAVLALLDLPATASESEVKGKLMALKHPGNVVPAEEVVALRAQLHEREISDTVNGALAEGKLTPVEKEWALGQATADLPAFKAFVASRPKQIPVGVTLPKEEPKAAALKVSDSDLAVAKQMGVSAETLAKYNN